MVSKRALTAQDAWVEPDGTWHQFGEAITHEDWAMREFGYADPEVALSDMLVSGWARVSWPDGVQVDRNLKLAERIALRLIEKKGDPQMTVYIEVGQYPAITEYEYDLEDGLTQVPDARIMRAALDYVDVAEFADQVRDDLGLHRFDLFYRPARAELKLDTIIVPRGRQKQGLGSEAMRRLNEFADAHGLRVTLDPAVRDATTTSQSRLVKFYREHGYTHNKGRNRDYAISEMMYREPQHDARGDSGRGRGGLHSDGDPAGAQGRSGLGPDARGGAGGPGGGHSAGQRRAVVRGQVPDENRLACTDSELFKALEALGAERRPGSRHIVFTMPNGAVFAHSHSKRKYEGSLLKTYLTRTGIPPILVLAQLKGERRLTRPEIEALQGDWPEFGLSYGTPETSHDTVPASVLAEVARQVAEALLEMDALEDPEARHKVPQYQAVPRAQRADLDDLIDFEIGIGKYADVNMVDEAPESHDDAFWDTKQPGRLDEQSTAFPTITDNDDPHGADPWAGDRRREGQFDPEVYADVDGLYFVFGERVVLMGQDEQVEVDDVPLSAWPLHGTQLERARQMSDRALQVMLRRPHVAYPARRHASPKKLEFLVKQFPKGERVLRYLAKHDPSRDRYKWLPFMWDKARTGEAPTSIAEAIGPYVQLRELRSKMFSKHRRDQSDEELWQEARSRPEYYLEAARMALAYEQAFIQELKDAFGSKRASEMAQRLHAFPYLSETVDPEHPAHGLLKLLLQAPPDEQNMALRGLTLEYNYQDKLKEMAQARENAEYEEVAPGIIKYLNYDAARGLRGLDTEWCWAYPDNSTFWDSYSERNELYSIELDGDLYGVAVSMSGDINEVRDAADKTPSEDVLSKIEEVFKKHGLAQRLTFEDDLVSANPLADMYQNHGVSEEYAQALATLPFPLLVERAAAEVRAGNIVDVVAQGLGHYNMLPHDRAYIQKWYTTPEGIQRLTSFHGQHDAKTFSFALSAAARATADGGTFVPLEAGLPALYADRKARRVVQHLGGVDVEHLVTLYGWDPVRSALHEIEAGLRSGALSGVRTDAIVDWLEQRLQGESLAFPEAEIERTGEYGHELTDLTEEQTTENDTAARWNESYRSENQYEDPNLKLGFTADDAWVEPDGTWHRLGSDITHEDWAQTHQGVSDRELVSAGWVRVMWPDGVYLRDNRRLAEDVALRLIEMSRTPRVWVDILTLGQFAYTLEDGLHTPSQSRWGQMDQEVIWGDLSDEDFDDFEEEDEEPDEVAWRYVTADDIEVKWAQKPGVWPSTIDTAKVEVEVQGIPVGYLTMYLYPSVDRRIARVIGSHLPEELRGQGYGKQMYRMALDYMRDMNAWLVPDIMVSEAARSLWRKWLVDPTTSKTPYLDRDKIMVNEDIGDPKWERDLGYMPEPEDWDNYYSKTDAPELFYGYRSARLGWRRLAGPARLEKLIQDHPRHEKLLRALAELDPTAPRYDWLRQMYHLAVQDPGRVRFMLPYVRAFREYEQLKSLDKTKEPLKFDDVERRHFESRVLDLREENDRLKALKEWKSILTAAFDKQAASYFVREVARASQRGFLITEPTKTVVDLLKKHPEQAKPIALMVARAFNPDAIRDRLENPPVPPSPDEYTDHGNGVIEYHTFNAAHASRGGDTNWCWAEDEHYFDSYGEESHLLSVHLSDEIWGIALDRQQGHITEIQNSKQSQGGAYPPNIGEIVDKLRDAGYNVSQDTRSEEEKRADILRNHGLDPEMWGPFFRNRPTGRLPHRAEHVANVIRERDTSIFQEVPWLLTADLSDAGTGKMVDRILTLDEALGDYDRTSFWSLPILDKIVREPQFDELVPQIAADPDAWLQFQFEVRNRLSPEERALAQEYIDQGLVSEKQIQQRAPQSLQSFEEWLLSTAEYNRTMPGASDDAHARARRVVYLLHEGAPLSTLQGLLEQALTEMETSIYGVLNGNPNKRVNVHPSVLEHYGFEDTGSVNPQYVQVRPSRTAQRAPTVCVDLDETLLEAPDYDHPEPSGQPGLGEPLHGAAGALKAFKELGWTVLIHSARFDKARSEEQAEHYAQEIRQVLTLSDIPFDDIVTGPKPIADYYIDDKAVPFEGDWWAIVKNVTKQAARLDPPPNMLFELRRRVEDLAGDEGRFTLRFDPEGWRQADDVKTRFPLRVIVSDDELRRIGYGHAAGAYHPAERTLYLRQDAPRRVMVHELTHYAQHLLSGREQGTLYGQPTRKTRIGDPAYDEHRRDSFDDPYAVSDVEFWPKLNEFIDNYDHILSRKDFAEATGGKYDPDTVILDALSWHPYFKALKREAPDKWRLAVKYAYDALFNRREARVWHSRCARSAAYAPTDPERRVQEVKFMREQLGLPPLPDDLEHPGYGEESWNNLYEQLAPNEGHPEMARVTVHSDRVVETHTMDAAYCLYGAGSQGIRTPWCGNRSRNLYEQYGGGGLRRFLVLPTGPDEYVEMDGQKVPVARDAYTFAVDAQGHAKNVNDYANRYLGRGLDVPKGQQAAAVLDQVMGFQTSHFFGASGGGDWSDFEGHPESWADEGFTPEEADEWRSLLARHDQYGGLNDVQHGESWSREPGDYSANPIEPEQVAADHAEQLKNDVTNGDIAFAERWLKTMLLVPDMLKFLQTDLKPEQIGDYVHAFPAHHIFNLDTVDPGRLRPGIAQYIMACVRHGLPPEVAAQAFENEIEINEDTIEVIPQTLEVWPSADDDVINFVLEDPTRRLRWLKTDPSPDEVAFLIENGLDEGQNPTKFLALWRNLDDPEGTSVMELLGRTDEVEEARRRKRGRTITLPDKPGEVLYHGTSRENVESILEHGLRAGTGDQWAGHTDEPDAPLHVYLSSSPEMAKRYAQGRAQARDPVVFAVRLPDPKLLEEDMTDHPEYHYLDLPNVQFRYPEDIPPEYLELVEVEDQTLFYNDTKSFFDLLQSEFSPFSSDDLDGINETIDWVNSERADAYGVDPIPHVDSPEEAKALLDQIREGPQMLLRRKQASGLVTFDFDGTLRHEDGSPGPALPEMKRLHAQGQKVMVVTSRTWNTAGREEVGAFLAEHGLEDVPVIMTGDDKWSTLLEWESEMHYDDDPVEVELCERYGIPVTQV